MHNNGNGELRCPMNREARLIGNNANTGHEKRLNQAIQQPASLQPCPLPLCQVRTCLHHAMAASYIHQPTSNITTCVCSGSTIVQATNKKGKENVDPDDPMEWLHRNDNFVRRCVLTSPTVPSEQSICTNASSVVPPLPTEGTLLHNQIMTFLSTLIIVYNTYRPAFRWNPECRIPGTNTLSSYNLSPT